MQNFIQSLSAQITNKELVGKILQFSSDVPTMSHALNKLRHIQQGTDEPIMNYNQRYTNLVERVEEFKLNGIRNTLYLNSKHLPKMLGEAMQQVQDLHIRHLYAMGEDQQSESCANPNDEPLPEITVNKVNTQENRSWYPRRYRQEHKSSEHLTNLCEDSQQSDGFNRRGTLHQPQSKDA